MKKNLVFVCGEYPVNFIEEEMSVTSQQFKHIYVVETECNSSNNSLPKNATAIPYNHDFSFIEKLKTCLFLLSPFFLKEVINVVRKQKPKHWYTIAKIQFICLLQAQALSRFLTQQFNIQESVFYSYWHDYNAMALALLRQRNPSAICVSRAHGWDVFAERQRIPYLPFKPFVFKNLSQTYSISDAGRNYFLQQFGNEFSSRISVSHLGKFNNRIPNMQKEGQSITMCSCSNIIPLKRIHCIIDILAELETDFQIHWIHFGEGPLRQDIEQYAQTRLQRTQVEFRGIVPNTQILDYYASNYIDLFINVSSSEGIPVSIMEAQSAGIPVVATNVGGTSEAVSETCGFLLPENFEISQAVGLVKGYLSSSVDIQQQYRQNAYAFWKDKYDAGKNYEEFYKEIISL